MRFQFCFFWNFSLVNDKTTVRATDLDQKGISQRYSLFRLHFLTERNNIQSKANIIETKKEPDEKGRRSKRFVFSWQIKRRLRTGKQRKQHLN